MSRHAAIDVSAARDRLKVLLPTALDALRQLVSINSFTHHAAGVDRVGDLLAALFEPLGFYAQRFQAMDCTTHARPPLGHHLILTRPGQSDRTIGLVGHLDTVFTEQEEHDHNFHWRPEKNRIYGPGTVDMKGGNVLIWMVMSAIQQCAPALLDQITWRVMFNAAEEGLKSDFGHRQRHWLGSNAIANLVFESGPQGDGVHHLICQRKGSADFRITAHGRTAHAGSAHERGINAIVLLSRFITKVNGLTDYTRQVTCNVGVVHGGTLISRVPDSAQAQMEIRAGDPQALEQTIEQVIKLQSMNLAATANDSSTGRLTIDGVKQMPVWPANTNTDRLAALWVGIGRSLNLPVVAGPPRGGLSDGNFTFDVAPTLDGLGPDGGNLHCAIRSPDGSADQEYVLPDSFIPRALLTALGIERLVSQSQTKHIHTE